MEVTWPLTRALDVGDRGVGVPVLRQLYNEMKAAPVKPDLGQLWSKLGIEIRKARRSLLTRTHHGLRSAVPSRTIRTREASKLADASGQFEHENLQPS